ncbi:MAG: hypothetical protein AAF483_17980, partial [Planctomycetota bacterium]
MKLFRIKFFLFVSIVVWWLQPDVFASQSDQVRELIEGFYDAIESREGYSESRKLAMELVKIGRDGSQEDLEARGLVRLSYLEIAFSKWGENWEQTLREATALSPNSSVAEAEVLMFSGHLKGKWLGEIASGMKEIRLAIAIAEEHEEDLMLAHAFASLADLYLLTGARDKAAFFAIRSREIAKHLNDSTAMARALRYLIAALHYDQLTELCLSYARELNAIRPGNDLSASVLARANQTASDHAAEVRAEIDRLKTEATTSREHNTLGRLYMHVAFDLEQLDQVRPAIESFDLAAEHFAEAENLSDYHTSLYRSYLLRLNHKIEMPKDRVFVDMVEGIDDAFLISGGMAEDIAAILDIIGETAVAKEWRVRSRNATIERLQTEHAIQVEAAAEYRNLGVQRRQQRKRLQRERDQFTYRLIGFGGAGASLVILVLLLQLATVRKSVKILNQEVVLRKTAQSNSDSLATQLLQAQKLGAIGSMSSGIVHDFNNTLHAIKSCSEAISPQVGSE